MSARGWIAGSNQAWDKNKALFPDHVIAFIKETQPDLWKQIEKLHGDELSGKLIETVIKERSAKGTLHIIRHGFKFYGKLFKLAYFKPAHGLVKETVELFAKNTLHVTRQIACHPADASIDENSRQLAEALIDGTKIVITTLQKFPFILRGLLNIAGADNPDKPDETAIAKAIEWQDAIATRRYAVIVDEAHSSQTGETARELKRIIGAGTYQGSEESDLDWEDGLYKVMESRSRQKNLSFFAFTATPKGKTLALFGRKGSSGKPEAFHTYSMKQAIEEGFILDVLQRYTPYKTYFKLVKSIKEDPAMPKKKAQKKLGKFMVLHPHNIEQKTEIIVEHFRDHVKQKLGGRAKAMVVTSSRLHAIRYMLSFQKYIKENHYSDIRPLVAFSGTVKDPETGEDYTEPSMNIDVISGKNISESQLPDKFDSSDYQVLLVANKYQTGFDQPLLCAMYVDKRLDGVQAVQTLSRLNRTSAGKEPPFVLDFVNESEEIYKAFKPYYNMTTLEKPSDPNHLELLKHELNAFQVYLWSEVVGFCHVGYTPVLSNRKNDVRFYYFGRGGSV